MKLINSILKIKISTQEMILLLTPKEQATRYVIYSTKSIQLKFVVKIFLRVHDNIFLIFLALIFSF